MRFIVIFWVLIPVATAFAAEDHTFFEKAIRPVFVEHCYECHSHRAKKLKGNLYLDSKPGWQRGGDSGPAIVPGAPDESLLIQGISYHDLDFQMPPKGKLAKAKIDAMRKWIGDGAPDPRAEEPAGHRVSRSELPGKDWWSFKPVATQVPPTVKQSSWPRDPLDQFVLAQLEGAGLAPAEDVSREALLRRVYFDLTGLPPGPEEVTQFVGEGNLAAVVDRLLASPRFGERWGRHWLDVARYAESSGGGRSLIFKEAWRYRDYVIDSFNRGKPYDQFLREQLAGDLLPADSMAQEAEQLTATGYLLLAPTNFENQDKELLDLEVVDEQLDTLGRTFMGLTIGCARCHDHKFDPISAKDYYAMAGILFSTECLKHANVSSPLKRDLPVSGDLKTKIDAFKSGSKQLEDQQKEIDAQLKQVAGQLKGGVAAADLPEGLLVDDGEAEKVGKWMESSHTREFVGKGYIHDNHGTTKNAEVHYTVPIPVADSYEVLISYSASGNRSQNARILIHHAEGVSTVLVNQRVAPDRYRRFVSVGTYAFSEGKQPAVVISNKDSSGVVIADAVLLIPQTVVPKEKPDSLAQREQQDRLLKEQDELKAALKAAKDELAAFKKSHVVMQPVTMAVRDRSKPEDTALRIRGEVHKKGELVPRGFLDAATWEPGAIGEGSGRLELADWLADPRHPLTARVMVNRLWYHLMGEGIVRTVDNFGTMGEQPTHPELLDYLAAEFVVQGWDIKAMIRRIMLSRSYAMRSQGSEAGEQRDPDNLLLWKAHHRRLDSEAMRDAMLAISGELDLTAGGRTFPDNLGSVFGYTFDHKLRSVYLPVFRNNLPEIFEVFDFADANRVAGRRISSTLPTQALYMMNSPFVIERAERCANRIMEADKSVSRLDQAFLETLGRKPFTAERKKMEAFLGDTPAKQDWTAVYHSLFGSLDFRYLR